MLSHFFKEFSVFTEEFFQLFLPGFVYFHKCIELLKYLKLSPLRKIRMQTNLNYDKAINYIEFRKIIGGDN